MVQHSLARSEANGYEEGSLALLRSHSYCGEGKRKEAQEDIHLSPRQRDQVPSDREKENRAKKHSRIYPRIDTRLDLSSEIPFRDPVSAWNG